MPPNDIAAIEPVLQRLAALAESKSSHLERKDFEFKLDDISDEGEFDGYASVFGNVDCYDDIVERGAFKKTIKESKGRVPILWQHDPYNPIGVSLELEEDDFGLRARGQLVLEVQQAAEARALMKAKALGGLSIGYQTVKYLIDQEGVDGQPVRRLKEVKLWEFSPVTFPANTLAVVNDVKSVDVDRLASLLRKLRSEDPELVKALLESTQPAHEATGDEAGAAVDADESAVKRDATLRAFADHLKTMTKEAHSG
jgi:HK97 family phage prohead protease